MAILSENSLLKDLSGHIGKKMLFKKYRDKTVVTAYPDINKNKKKSPLQKLRQGWFEDAVAYAQNIIRNRELKKQYEQKVKKGKSVYNYAIKEYLEQYKRKPPTP
jgi:hypothetical protein